MKKMSPLYKLKFKRRREGKTNYVRRLGMLRSTKPRLVVRKSLKNIYAQIVGTSKDGDKTFVSASSNDLKKLGWTFSLDSVPAAYLVGLLVGKKAKAGNIPEAILDSGLYTSTKGSKVYSVVKGVLDSGMSVPVDAEMLPSEDRLSGKHLHKITDKLDKLQDNLKDVKQKILSG